MEYITEIIIALLTFSGALIGSLLAHSKNQAVMQEQIKGVKEDINTLSDRVDKHNNLIERMAVVENKVETLERRGD